VLLAVVIRPTNAVIWCIPVLDLAWRSAGEKRLMINIRTFVGYGIVSLLITLAVDSYCYGQFQFVPWNFLRLNLGLDGGPPVSIYYGANGLFWYFTQALPLLWWTASPHIIYGIYLIWCKGDRPVKVLLGTSILTILIYSSLEHKEQRFLLPLQSTFSIFAAFAEIQSSKERRIRQWVVLTLIATNLPIAWYTLQVHQRGVIDVMTYLHHLPSCQADSVDCLDSLGFLMPCHSTPWQSHLLRPELQAKGKVWALTCEPPIGPNSVADYVDEADLFYRDPIGFLSTCLSDQSSSSTGPESIEICDSHWSGRSRPWPSHLVLFEASREAIGDILIEKGYHLQKSIFNSHFHDDARRRGDVLVYVRRL